MASFAESFTFVSMSVTLKSGGEKCYGAYECESAICQGGECLGDNPNNQKWVPGQQFAFSWPALSEASFDIDATVSFRYLQTLSNPC